MKFVYLTDSKKVSSDWLRSLLPRGSEVRYTALGVPKGKNEVVCMHPDDGHTPESWLNSNEFKQAVICVHDKSEKVVLKKFVNYKGEALWAMYSDERLGSALSLLMRDAEPWCVLWAFSLLELTPAVLATNDFLRYTGPFRFIEENVYVGEP